jgi:hypothetical protein
VPALPSRPHSDLCAPRRTARYGLFDYAAAQTLAAAAHFLEFDGIIVPSAGERALHLVVFLGRVLVEDALAVQETQPVDRRRGDGAGSGGSRSAISRP